MFNSFRLDIILNVPSFFSLRKTVEINWPGSCELSIIIPYTRNIVICQVILEASMMEHLTGMGTPNWVALSKNQFYKTNCCQYIVIWCKCSPVINKVFTIACNKGFTTVIIILLRLSWQEFACANVGLLLTCVKTGSTFVLQSCSLWANC